MPIIQCYQVFLVGGASLAGRASRVGQAAVYSAFSNANQH